MMIRVRNVVITMSPLSFFISEKSLLGLTTTTPPKEDFTLGYTSDELINFLADDSFENADNFCASQSCSMMFRSNNNISLLHNGSSGASGGPKLNHSYGVSLSAPNSNESVPVEVGTSGPDYRSRGNGVGSISNFYQGPRHNNSYLQQQPHFERNVGESNYDSIETELSPFHHQKNNASFFVFVRKTTFCNLFLSIGPTLIRLYCILDIQPFKLSKFDFLLLHFSKFFGCI